MGKPAYSGYCVSIQLCSRARLCCLHEVHFVDISLRGVDKCILCTVINCPGFFRILKRTVTSIDVSSHLDIEDITGLQRNTPITCYRVSKVSKWV